MRCLLAVALTGCMKIYPSSELPDVEVDWYAEECAAETSVVVAFVGIDDGSYSETTVPCTDGGFIVEDVDRVRYRVDGALLAEDGSIAVTSSQEVDLRNGINQSASLYFPESAYLRITWDFADGASCESLAADTVDLDFFDADFGSYTMSTSCRAGLFVGYPFGEASVQLRAVSRRITVAVSERFGPIEVMPPDEVTIGPITLVPCGSDCPD